MSPSMDFTRLCKLRPGKYSEGSGSVPVTGNRLLRSALVYAPGGDTQSAESLPAGLILPKWRPCLTLVPPHTVENGDPGQPNPDAATWLSVAATRDLQ